ncbi:MAG: NADPH:quinone reductase [Gammaproteobacteria bacterium]
MKAIRVNKLGEPEVLEYQEVPTPEPEKDQFLIKIKAAGVNPVDTYIRSGYQGYDPTVPYTPGYDAAGIVEKVGDQIINNTKSITSGMRVYLSGSISGTYAEYAICNSDQIHPLPDHISFAQGASLYVAYVTAYRGLIQRAKASPGETVLIHGASGAVGIAAIQFARNSGLRIIATASTEEGQLLVAEQGADLVIDHSDPAHFDLISDYTESKGVDIILEMAANINLSKDLKILAQNGRVIIVGNRDTIEINPRDTMACDGSIIGMSLMNISDQDEKEIHAAINAGLNSSTIIPVIRCELPLVEAPSAHRMVMESGASGKIILIP